MATEKKEVKETAKAAPKAAPAKAEAKKVEAKPAAKPAPKAEAKPAAKAEAKPAAKAEKPAAKAPAKAEKPAKEKKEKPAGGLPYVSNGQISVELVKSTNSCTVRQIRTVQALGLSKINDKHIHKDNPAIRGMIEVVAHLVKVEKIS